jgi:hypothetical protein
MSKEIKNLKPWDFVKDKVHNLSGIKAAFPEDYLYQSSNGVYYPAIKITDIPKDFEIKFAH